MGFAFQGFYPLVLLARALQGIGGSSLPALVMVIVARYFAPEVRGRLFGSIGSVIAFAAGVGPVVGGFVSGRLHWAWLFLIPLLTLVALPFVNRILPDEETRPGRIDLPGAALMALGLGSLILWLSYPQWPWLVAGLILMAGFILRILSASDPFIDPRLFANRPYSAGVLTTLVLFGAFMGIFFMLPLMLHGAAGLDSSAIGLVLFPGAISGVFFGPFAGRLADSRGNQFVMPIGLCLLVAGLAAFSLIPGSAYIVLGAALVVVNVGVTFFQTGLINSVSQTLPPEETGVGMGVFNLVGFLAGAVGTAAVAKVLDAKLLDFGGIMAVLALLLGLAGGLYVLSHRSRLREPDGEADCEPDCGPAGGPRRELAGS
jgi:DHA2 family metal-tetracycline-proton antiporter-like MFS transporter